jgi:hypothetical protein
MKHYVEKTKLPPASFSPNKQEWADAVHSAIGMLDGGQVSLDHRVSQLETFKEAQHESLLGLETRLYAIEGGQSQPEGFDMDVAARIHDIGSRVKALEACSEQTAANVDQLMRSALSDVVEDETECKVDVDEINHATLNIANLAAAWWNARLLAGKGVDVPTMQDISPKACEDRLIDAVRRWINPADTGPVLPAKPQPPPNLIVRDDRAEAVDDPADVQSNNAALLDEHDQAVRRATALQAAIATQREDVLKYKAQCEGLASFAKAARARLRLALTGFRELSNAAATTADKAPAQSRLRELVRGLETKASGEGDLVEKFLESWPEQPGERDECAG